jgi:CO dehydrogenase nickel-insertion accessory protein CooC1
LLGQLESEPDRVVIADFEAGLGTVLRMDTAVDVVIAVVQPTVKSIDVGVRAAEAVRERQLGRVKVVANRVAHEDDVARVRAAFHGVDAVVVPDDPAIGEAERRGLAPLDAAPSSPAVTALVRLGRDLAAGR